MCPNLSSLLFNSQWTVNGELRVGFFSKKSISKGEEITFDYKYERYGQQAQECFCGSSNCQRWLGGEPGNDDDDEDDEEDDEEEDYWSSTDEEEEEEEEENQNINEENTVDVQSKIEEVQGVMEKVVEEESLKPIVRVEKQVLEADKDDDYEAEIDENEELKMSPIKSPPPQRKTKKRKKRRKSPRKIKNYDNDHLDDEIEKLVSTGIRTHNQTLSFTRQMLQVTDTNTQMTLINLMKDAADPCKRLFLLDYHGLKIIYNQYMSELGWTKKELEMKIAVLELLTTLNIPNKTILMETKVWQAVNRWSKANNKEELAKLAEEDEMQQSRAASPINKGSNISSVTSSRTNTPPPSDSAASSVMGTPVSKKIEEKR